MKTVLPALGSRFATGCARDRHTIVLAERGIGYVRVPKVANTRIKALLAAHLGLLPDARGRVASDRYWRALAGRRIEMVTARELRRRWPDAFVFAFVRNPFDRLLSCYNSKILARYGLGNGMLRSGMNARMSFAEFVERVATIPDRRAQIHFRSQADILTWQGRLVPQFVGRFEHLAEDWERLTCILRERHGVHLAPWPAQQAVSRRPPAASPWTPALAARVRERFRADFELFYPGTDDPV